jgi:hypothetical protein
MHDTSAPSDVDDDVASQARAHSLRWSAASMRWLNLDAGPDGGACRDA